MFEGVSSLRREAEEESRPRPVSTEVLKLQEYLAQQYGSGPNSSKEKKKKKNSKAADINAAAVRVVDHDISGFHEEQGPPGGADNEDGPLIANPEEAEVLRAQAEREREMFHRAGGASGWEVVDDPTNLNGDALPPRRRQGRDNPEQDASPPRRRQRHDSPEQDASPPRRQQPVGIAEEDLSGGCRADGDKARRLMSDGTLAGMMSGKELMQEMAIKRAAEGRRFAMLNPDATGREAETIYRDKSGRRVTKDEYAEARALERRADKPQYDEESALAWGGGLRQRAQREEEERRMREEAARPFARGYDERLDAEQREIARWGDPMAHLVKKKAPSLPVELPPSLVAARSEELKKSGFIIPMEVPSHSWLRRGLGAPPNRYNIKPGRHWDGVDRSNGFERDFFKMQTERRRKEQDAYLWAQEEM